MVRGQHKRWHPSIQPGVVHEQERFVNPMPRGAHPDTSQQHRGNELSATEQSARGGYRRVHERSIADFWSVKGSPINGKGSKATKRSGKDAGPY